MVRAVCIDMCDSSRERGHSEDRESEREMFRVIVFRFAWVCLCRGRRKGRKDGKARRIAEEFYAGSKKHFCHLRPNRVQ